MAATAVCFGIMIEVPTAMKEVMLELIPTFESTSGHKLSIGYESSNAIQQQIKGGASADLVILTSETIDDLSR